MPNKDNIIEMPPMDEWEDAAFTIHIGGQSVRIDLSAEITDLTGKPKAAVVEIRKKD